MNCVVKKGGSFSHFLHTPEGGKDSTTGSKGRWEKKGVSLKGETAIRREKYPPRGEKEGLFSREGGVIRIWITEMEGLREELAGGKGGMIVLRSALGQRGLEKKLLVGGNY